MYFNVTKCSSLVLSCLIPLSLLAKDAKPVTGQGSQKPLCFIENKGQVTDKHNRVRSDIQYELSSPGVNLYVGSGGICYQFRKVTQAPAEKVTVSAYQMNVELLGANKHAEVVNESDNEYVENYYLGANNFTAHSYNKIRYKDVYPGIDWVLYVKGQEVEYDFEVKPGADVNNIKLKYNGATALNATANGGITAVTPMGKVSEKKPFSYEAAGGKEIASRFVVKDNIVSFEAAPHTGTLVIDPSIQWSTYIGGTGEDVVTSVKLANTGNVFACGYTSSATNIFFSPGFDNVYHGSFDAFVACYNPTGARVWATYVGGSSQDRGASVALDLAGTSVYMGGFTASAAMSSGAVYQSAPGGGNDGLVIKLVAANGTRTWATYYGGAGDDRINAISVDAANNVLVTGITSSTTAISSGGVYQTALSGPTDAFVAKLSGGGLRVWGTYYGGSAQEEGFGIATDASNNIIITGQTNSVTGIANIGSHQAFLSGTNDAFLAKLNTNGTARAWGTYFGGPGTEQGNAVAVDQVTGMIAVVGNTTSTAAIATVGSHQPTYGGGVQDAFLIYMTNAGFVKWSTYYGGTSLDYGEDVCLDQYRNIVIAGGTFSTNGIASDLSSQPSIGGDYDAYAAKFMINSQRLWGTYFGNALYDYAFGVACNANGEMVLGGHTTSTAGIATAGAPQVTYGGGVYEGFITKYVIDTFVTINLPYVDTLLCAGGPSFNVAYTVNKNFRTTNNFIVQLSNASGSFAAPLAIGSIASNTSGVIPVTIPVGQPTGTGYRIRIVSTAPAFASPDDSADIHIVNTPPASYAWGTTPTCVGATIKLFDTATYKINSWSWAGPVGFTSTLQFPTIAPASLANSGTYTVTTTHNGCPSSTSTVDVTVNSFIPPTPTVTATNPACLGSAISFTATSGLGSSPVTYSWAGPAGFTSTMQNPSVASATFAHTGTYYLVDTFAGCPSDTAMILVTVLGTTPASVMITVDPNDTVCAGTMVTFTATPVNGGITPTYQWSVGGAPVVGAISPTWSTSTLSDGDIVMATLHSSVTCPSPVNAFSNAIKMTIINNSPIAYITATPGTSVPTGSNITFNSIVFNGGVGALYQWQLNGADIPGATNSTYTLVGVTSTETIRMVVTSTMGCAVPASATSNALVVHTNVGVSEIPAIFDDVTLYPNPNAGTFTIKGSVNNQDAVLVEVLNTLGQTIHNEVVRVSNGALDSSIDVSNVPNGVYLMRISADGVSKAVRFTISK